jgi:hypothetical protein
MYGCFPCGVEAGFLLKKVIDIGVWEEPKNFTYTLLS